LPIGWRWVVSFQAPPEAQSEAAAPRMQVQQSVSPNLGIRLQRFVRR
jgi:hypothetical protein